MAEDRYQPLPPVTRLPALWWSRMGRYGRAATVAAGLALIAAAIVLAPQIADTKRDNAERDRQEAAAAEARQAREFRELVRPRTGVTNAPADPLPDLERLITADARGRPGAGRVLRTDCRPIRGGGRAGVVHRGDQRSPRRRGEP